MQTTLNIEGMSCGNCVKHVTKALTEITGVKSVSVSLENKSAVIEHEDSVSATDLENAVEDAGYDIVR